MHVELFIFEKQKGKADFLDHLSPQEIPLLPHTMLLTPFELYIISGLLCNCCEKQQGLSIDSVNGISTWKVAKWWSARTWVFF